MRRFTWQESSDLLTEDLTEFLAEEPPERGNSVVRKYWVGELVDLLHSHDERVNGYVEENQFPVLLKVTDYRLAWVGGDSAARVLESVQNSGEAYEYLEGADHLDIGDVSAEEVDTYELQSYVYNTKLGPYLACRTCEHPGPWDGLSGYAYTTHKDDCPVLAEDRVRRDREYEEYRARREAERAARLAEQQGS